jgi:nicotinate-nucleotide adenylyltransferase
MGDRIGLYGGTFDPLHFGHLNLAIEIKEAHSLDQIWFCPAQMNPFKKNVNQTSAQHRLAMLKNALHDIDFFRILDTELQRPGPSYTVDTLQSLLTDDRYSSNTFSLILGDDAIPGFFNWKMASEIVQMVPLLIGRRSANPLDFKALKGDPNICEAILKGLTQTKVMDISSTDIRKRIANGLYCGHQVPAKVLDYIYENRLYSSTL